MTSDAQHCIALVLTWVMCVSSMLWAAPPVPRAASGTTSSSAAATAARQEASPAEPDPDINNDGVVNIYDVSLASSCYQWDFETQDVCPCLKADTDGDWDIDFEDLYFVIGGFDQTGFPQRDTLPPNVRISRDSEPNAHGWSNTPVTVSFECFDCDSGVSVCPADVVVDLDGADQSVNGTATDVDGNTASVSLSVSFDATPPDVEITEPAADVLTTTPAVRVSYSDALSGIDVATVVVLLDGVDITSALSIGPGQLGGVVPAALILGPHELIARISDFAGNESTASSNFVVSAEVPLGVEITSPASGSYHGQSPVHVTGTLTGATPQTSVECIGSVSVSATVTGSAFSCNVPLTEGDNLVRVVATAPGSAAATAETNLFLDTIAPAITIISPMPPHYTSSNSVDVSGGVIDDSPVTVRVEGPMSVPASVSGTQFTAADVPLGAVVSGSQLTLRVLAEDAAGNVGEASFQVIVDLDPPNIVFDEPPDGAIVRSPFLVSGTVTDASPVGTVNVNGEPVVVSSDRFETTVVTADGGRTITATAQDAAGNSGSASLNVFVDSTPPLIDVTAPSDGAITNENPVRLEGSIADATAVTFTVNGDAAGSGFPVDVSLSEGSNTLELVATDAAGNQAPLSLEVTLDTVAPALNIVGPAQDEVLAELPVLVQGTVTDATPTVVTVSGVEATKTQDAWQLSVPSAPEGPNSFEVVATDAAGNSTTLSRDVFVDLTAPVVEITAPGNGTLTNASDIFVSGSVTDISEVSVAVNGIPAPVDGGGNFVTSSGIPLADGDNTLLAVATDAGGRVGEASVLVTQDAIPPVVTLTTPETISQITSGQVLAAVSDNIGVAEVQILVDGVVEGTFLLAPYEITLVASDTALPGDTVTVTVNATDVAGNTATESRGVQVVADGILVGQVLSDATSLPIEGASIELGQRMVSTDARGMYSIPTGNAQVILTASHDGMTSVERRLSVAADVGTVPVDARLTALGSEHLLATDGVLEGTQPTPLGDVGVRIQVPSAALPGPTTFRLTPLSAQGLPALLPLGWSPLAGWDLRSDVAPLSSLEATLSGLPVVGDVHLVRYDDTLHEWLMVESGLSVVSGELTVSIPVTGAYALVAGDAGRADLVVPAVSEVLGGVEMELISELVTSEGVVDPPVLPPAGGIAFGTLLVFSPETLPSGTVVQAEITETFTLATGAVASEETRLEDIVLFQIPADDGVSLAAKFAISSSRSFAATELVEGKVHLDILAGRESVRGQRGGNRALTLDEGDVRITVASQSLNEDTAVALRLAAELSPFVPVDSGLEALGEVDVDLSGQTLAFSAQLSLGGTGVPDGSTLFVTRVDRLDGVPHLTVVALARVEGDRVVTQTVPGLAGVRSGGRYVFYRATNPLGFVAGTATSTAGPVKAVIQTGGLPFLTVAEIDGSYMAAALVGNTSVSASVPGTSLAASETALIGERQTTDLDLTLLGAVTTASVTPADGSVGVALTAQLEIVTTAPVDETSVTTTNIQLFEGPPVDNQLVPLRFVVSGSGRTIAIIPETGLKFSTEHTLRASGLTDIFRGAVTLVSSTFVTRDESAPVLATDQLVLSMPDDSGIVEVSAPAGTFPPGSSVLIVNAGNGVVVSFTADNDGAIFGDFPAGISDRILITITDPSGNVTSIERSKFVAPDGTTGIGPGGGVVEGEGGVQLRIPEGTLDTGITFKIGAFDENLFPPEQRPELDGAKFGAGLRIETSDIATFNKEIDLAFPKPPDAPDGAFYYVYRRLEGPELSDGTKQVLFEVIDQAFVEGEGDAAKVVTASYPFAGYQTSFGAVADAAIFGVKVTHNILMWAFNELIPGRPEIGVITGQVQRTVLDEGSTQPRFKGVKGKLVSRVDEQGRPLVGNHDTVAITQSDGTFTLWDKNFIASKIRVQIEDQGVIYAATAFPRDPLTNKSPPPALEFYENIATANITLPPAGPTPAPPRIGILVMEESDGERRRSNGLVVAGQPVIIGFRSEHVIQGATINGATFSARIDTAPTGPPVDYVLDQPFVPSRAGSYEIEATAVPIFGPPIRESIVFRAIAPGGSNNDVLPDEPPRVNGIATVPRNGAEDVPVTIFPQVVFTEPVKNIPGNVTLSDSTGEQIPLVLSGVGPGGVFENISASGVTVTSLTMVPMTGLNFGESYELNLSAGIIDLDVDSNMDPAPKNLVPFQTSFTTFGPRSLGRTEDRFGSAGLAVLDDRAFLVENFFSRGLVRVFDLSDPALLEEITSAQASITHRPVDIAGEGSTIVVATSTTNRSVPSNLLVFDVSQRSVTRWDGAATLASTAVEGFAQAVDILDGLAYTLTGRRGVQIVDLAKARSNFQQQTGGELFSAGYWDMVRQLNRDGLGFGQDAVSQAIALPRPGSTRDYFQSDLAVANISGQACVVTTGEAPLIVVDPVFRTATPSLEIATIDGQSSVSQGSAVALARIAGFDLTVLGGWGHVGGGSPGPVLAIVDMCEPTAPLTLSLIELPLDSSPVDVLIHGDLAIVSDQTQAVIVSLANPSQPRVTGTVPTAGGVLALSEAGVLISTGRSRFGGDSEQGGVNASALEPFVHVSRGIVAVNKDDEDDNKSPDRLDPGPSPKEQDLRPVTLIYDRSDEEAQVTLQATSGSSRVAFWLDDKKATPLELGRMVPLADAPERFFIEGLQTGEVELQMTLTKTDGTSLQDETTLHVVDVEFVETNEQVVSGLPTDSLRLFNPNPIVVMDVATLSGAGATRAAEVSGTVMSFVAPIEEVQVNGVAVRVNETSSGPDDQGPFEGEFSTRVTVGPMEALIVATAVNALGNGGVDTIGIVATRQPDGSVVQSVKPLSSVPAAGSTNLDDFRFRVEVQDSSVGDDTVSVTIDGHSIPIELERTGPETFESKHLYLLPDGFDIATLPEPLRETRIPSGLGANLRVLYGEFPDEGIVTGTLWVAPARSSAPFTAGEKMPFGLPYDIVNGVGSPTGLVALVGAPGKNAAGEDIPTHSVTVRSLLPNGNPVTGPAFTLQPGQAAPPPTVDLELERVDDHLYRSPSGQTILPVSGPLPAAGVSNFTPLLVDPAGFVELASAAQHRLPLAAPAVREPDNPARDRRLVSHFTPEPIVLFKQIEMADKDLAAVTIGKVQGLVISFSGTTAPTVVEIQDDFGRMITPMVDPTHELHDVETGIFVHAFSSGPIDLSKRDKLLYTVSATVGAKPVPGAAVPTVQFGGSSSIELEVQRDTSNAVTDITMTRAGVRPSLYQPLTVGPDADSGKIKRESLERLLEQCQFLLVGNALLSDTRFAQSTTNPRQFGIVKSGADLSDEKRFPLAEQIAAAGEINKLGSGVVRTQRLTAVPEQAQDPSDTQLPTLLGEIRAAASPLLSVSLAAAPPTARAFVFALDLQVDTNHDSTIDEKDDLFENGKWIREGIVSRTLVINDDDDDADGNVDNEDATVNGDKDKKTDLGILRLTKLPPELTGGTLTLRVSDKTVLRVFDDTDTALLGPAPGGPDRDGTDATDMLLQRLQGPDDLEFRVEGVKLGSALLSLIYQDAAGKELCRDEVLVAVVPPVLNNLTGVQLSEYPFIDFGNTFQKGPGIGISVDGFLRPDAIGRTGKVYIVEHKSAAGWLADPNLTDRSTAIENITVKALDATKPSSIAENWIEIGDGVEPGEYDVVIDFGTNAEEPGTPDGTFDPGVDFIDRLDRATTVTPPPPAPELEAGLYVVEDPTVGRTGSGGAGGTIAFGTGHYEITSGTFNVPFAYDGLIAVRPPGSPATIAGLPFKARVSYPAPPGTSGASVPVAAGRFPLVVIAHGNHAPRAVDISAGFGGCLTSDENYRGYSYLQDHLAKQGYISVSVGLDEVSRVFPGISLRSWIVLKHLENMVVENSRAGSPINGAIDISNTSLLGHSRGGEAVVEAYRLLTTPALRPVSASGTPETLTGFSSSDIKAFVSLAPTTFFSTSGQINDLPLLMLYGSADDDVSGSRPSLTGFVGANMAPFRQMDRTDGSKQLLFIEGANHNYFNSSWGFSEANHEIDGSARTCVPKAPVGNNLITDTQQRDLTKAYVLAFLERHIGGELGYQEFFSRSTELLRPNGVATSIPIHGEYRPRKDVTDFVFVDDHESGNGKALNERGGKVEFTPLNVEEVALDGTGPATNFFNETNGALVQWSGSANGIYSSEMAPATTPPAPPASVNVSSFEYLSFRVGQQGDHSSATADIRIAVILEDAEGRTSQIRAQPFATLPEPYTRLDDSTLTKSHLKTFRIPLAGFLVEGAALDLQKISRVRFQMEPANGSVGLDNVEFTKN